MASEGRMGPHKPSFGMHSSLLNTMTCCKHKFYRLLPLNTSVDTQTHVCTHDTYMLTACVLMCERVFAFVELVASLPVPQHTLC